MSVGVALFAYTHGFLIFSHGFSPSLNVKFLVVIVKLKWFVGAQFAAPILFRMAYFTVKLQVDNNPFFGHSFTCPLVISLVTFLHRSTSSVSVSLSLPRYSLIVLGENFTIFLLHRHF
jgi:hypothetical protein